MLHWLIILNFAAIGETVTFAVPDDDLPFISNGEWYELYYEYSNVSIFFLVHNSKLLNET